MTVLALAVVLLWIVMILNVALTLALARRLRALSGRVAPMLPEPGLEPGDEAPEFEAVTHDGQTVQRRSPGGGATVLGFFSSTCHACPEHAPQFRALAERAPGGAQVVAVVDGSPAEAERLLGLLDGVPTVVGPWSPEGITARYRVSAFPSFLVAAPDGRVVATGGSTAEVVPAVA